MPLSLDHVHIMVESRTEAAEWFAEVLDFEADPDLSAWQYDPMGPLIIRSREGAARLALFARDREISKRDHTVAFATSGAEFLTYIERLGNAGIRDSAERAISLHSIVDHAMAWSVYFTDPWGNRFEITTYDREPVAVALRR